MGFLDLFFDPAIGTCDTCRVDSGPIIGYGGSSGMPFYRCSKCTLVREHQADIEAEYRIAMREKAYQEALGYYTDHKTKKERT